MHKPTNYYSPQMVTQLTRLLEQLRNEIDVLEQPFMQCPNKYLNETAGSLNRECRQYATEISAYIHSFTGKPEPAGLGPGNDTATKNEYHRYSITGYEMLQYFGNAEQRLLTAYRVALNEPFLTHDVRAILRKQFNSLLYLFLQTKILDLAH